MHSVINACEKEDTKQSVGEKPIVSQAVDLATKGVLSGALQCLVSLNEPESTEKEQHRAEVLKQALAIREESKPAEQRTPPLLKANSVPLVKP